jgi:hypothetical protein
MSNQRTEKLRCLKYGSVIRLCRGHFPKGVFPDNLMGRAHLFELVCVASLAPACADQKVEHLIGLWAPWMPAAEAQNLKKHLSCLTVTERWHSPRDIGRTLYCTNAEREAWALWQILPCDMTDEQLVAFRADKRRKQLEKRRRRKGIRSRAEYRAELANRPKPWLDENITQRQWQRRNVAGSVSSPMSRGLSPIIVDKQESHPTTSPGVSQQEAFSKEGEPKSPYNITTAERVERLKPPRLYELESHPTTSAEDERLIAMNNWGKNAERKKSTSPKTPWTKPTFSEELRDFAEFPLEANELAIKEAS